MRRKGAALLSAMLTVTLVASFAAAALWQQWRNVEIESTQRSRMQLQWVLNGALDWARLILQEDARNGDIDHLSEPWALPLQEARLSSFLAVDAAHADDSMDAFLSGQITDQQSLLNVRNLVIGGQTNNRAVQAFGRLFDLLRLPRSQLLLLESQLLAAQAASDDGSAASEPSAQAPLTPARMDQLVWLGLPPATVQALLPYATLLPVATPVNLNTASAEVVYAVIPDIDLVQARRLVSQRAAAHFNTVRQALLAAGLGPAAAGTLSESQDYGVGSHYFTVQGRLRLGDVAVQEVSLVERNGKSVKVVSRQREALAAPAQASLQ